MWSTFLHILIPLIFAAIIGFMTGRWWTKRWYEDVTESYDELRVKTRSSENADMLTKSDLDDRIASLSSSVASIPQPDLDPLASRLSTIETTVAGLSFPETDLTPVYERMTRIDQRLAQPNPEFDKLASRLARLEESVGGISSQVSSLHNADLDPIQERFSKLEQAIEAIDVTMPDVDLSQVENGLTQLELAINNMDAPEMDLSPIQEQLTGLELRVVDLAEKIEETRGDEYDAIRSELGSMSSSFAAFAVPDLEPVAQRLSSVEQAMSNIQLPETDLAPLYERLEQLEESLKEPNGEYQKLYARLAGMEAAIDALDRGPIDFGPVHSRIAAVENLINAMRADMHSIGNLEPVERQLASLQQSILSMPRPDLSIVERQLANLEQTVMSIPQPDLSPVISSMRTLDSRMDMGAMESRLTAIEYGLTAVHHMLRSRQNAPAPISNIEPELYAQNAQPNVRSTVTTQTYTSQPVQTSTTTTSTHSSGVDPLAGVRRPNDESNLLQEAAFGAPDDLERISGVGPMLSDMLQDIGVYYFWQIAEWDEDDIVWVDNKLEHFKGRIERDNWVGQARQFAAEPQTANRPN